MSPQEIRDLGWECADLSLDAREDEEELARAAAVMMRIADLLESAES